MELWNIYGIYFYIWLRNENHLLLQVWDVKCLSVIKHEWIKLTYYS